MAQTMLRLPAVKMRTALSRSSIYKFVTAGTFPCPVRIGPRAVAWIESEVNQWIERRIAESRPGLHHEHVVKGSR
jgi:prophage regulatory protein